MPNALTETELGRVETPAEGERRPQDGPGDPLQGRQLFSPGRRTAKPLSVRLRPPGPVPGHGHCAGRPSVSRSGYLRLGQQATLPEMSRGCLPDRHHPGDPPTIEAHLWGSPAHPRSAPPVGNLVSWTQAGGPVAWPKKTWSGSTLVRSGARGRLDAAPAADLLEARLPRPASAAMSAGWPTSPSSRPARASSFWPGVRDLCGRGLVGWSMGTPPDQRTGHRGRHHGRGPNVNQTPNSTPPQRQGLSVHLARLHQPSSRARPGPVLWVDRRLLRQRRHGDLLGDPQA